MRKEIIQHILFIRGQRVILDRDLAFLYAVKPIALRQQVKRNARRFPNDFVFQLTKQETAILVSQSVIPSQKHLGGFLPYAFTEHGVAMLSSVLRSQQAIDVNIAIVRAFVKLRHVLTQHRDLAARLEKVESKVDLHDTDLRLIVAEIQKLIDHPQRISSPIKGFTKD